MNTKALWVLLAFLLWGGGSTYWYVCKIKGFCQNVQAANWQENSAENPKDTIVKPAVEKDVLIFELGQTEPVVTDSEAWNNALNGWKSNIQEGKLLKVIVPYLSSEFGGDEGQAQERLSAMKTYLFRYMDTASVVLEIKQVEGNGEAGFVNAFKGYFMVVEKPAPESIKRIGQNKALIYFPSNSTRAELNDEILQYLDETAKILKENPGWKVKITGYTDNTGSPRANFRLGYKRARVIRNILVSKGVPSASVIVKSGGENNPVADNSTPEGRRMNRRVEVEILQQ